MTRLRRLRRWLEARIVRPVALDRVLFAFSVLVLNISVLVGLLGVIADKNEVREKLNSSDAVAACRNRITSQQSNAQTDYLLDLGDLVLTPQDGRPAIAVRARLDGERLRAARDLRVAFEANPVVDELHPCPIP